MEELAPNQSMKGKTTVSIGLLKWIQDKVTEVNSELKLEFLHCIIHQHVLCKSVLKLSHVID